MSKKIEKIQVNSDDYLKAVNQGFTALARYLDDWDKPVDFLVEGFIGEGVNLPFKDIIDSKLAALKADNFSKLQLAVKKN